MLGRLGGVSPQPTLLQLSSVHSRFPRKITPCRHFWVRSSTVRVPNLTSLTTTNRFTNHLVCSCTTVGDAERFDLSLVTGEPANNAADDDWKEWLLKMKELYHLGIYQDFNRESLEEAVSREDFEEASSIRDLIHDLEKDDLIVQMKKELAAAVVEERFADASRLRDTSHSSLEGWWVARGEDDPCGKLVHIQSNYSCYIGREYSTSDIAEAHGWTDDVSGGSQLPNPDERLENMGRGSLEVYLRKDKDGNVEHQACVLKSPSGADSLDVLSLSEQVKIGVEKHKDLFVDMLHQLLRERQATMDSTDEEEEEDTEEDDTGISNHTSLPSQWSISDEIDASTEAQFDFGSSRSDNEDIDELAASEGDDDNYGKPESQIDQSVDANLYRVRAGLHWLDRNHFFLKVDEDKGPQQLVPEPWGGQPCPRTGSYLPEEFQLMDMDDRMLPSRADASTPFPSFLSDSISDGVSETVEKVLSEAVDQHLHRVSEENAELTLGNEIDWKEIAGYVDRADINSLHDIVNELKRDEDLQKEICSKLTKSLIENMKRSSGLEGEVTFSRVPTNIPKTDPFSGLYLGAFGPHGPELLLVRRVDNGNNSDMVEGIKLTGDPNVPAGEISFRVNVGRSNRQDCRDKYPPELGIIARYPGEGRVAEVGFSHPRWVTGEFLQFRQSGGPLLTGGAELGFVWAVPGARRFLILLQRLNLQS